MNQLQKSSRGAIPALSLIALILSMTNFSGCQHSGSSTHVNGDISLQQDMEAYCSEKLAEGELSKLSAKDKMGTEYRAFFSRKLHTCIESFITVDPKNSAATNYVLSDMTYGFLSAPKWHPLDLPLHIHQINYGRDHHLYAEGYWAAVSTDPGKQSSSDANSVDLTCDYGDRSFGEEANSCTEKQGYVQFGSLHNSTQGYHVASWNADEVIATDSEEGISGSTTTTLIIHPQTSDIQVIDRTKMDERQPKLFEGIKGKSFGDHFELHGGMYVFSTSAAIFQCDEDGIVINMRLDVAKKHNGDVYDVPNAEWNAGSKSASKYTSQQCDAAMKQKLSEIH